MRFAVKGAVFVEPAAYRGLGADAVMIDGLPGGVNPLLYLPHHPQFEPESVVSRCRVEARPAVRFFHMTGTSEAPQERSARRIITNNIVSINMFFIGTGFYCEV